MSFYPYTITAIAKNTNEGSNVVAGGLVSLLDSDGQPVVMYDDAEGNNGSTGKQCDARGQVTVYLPIGEYALNVNGQANGRFTVTEPSKEVVSSYATTTQIAALKPKAGDVVENQERANAKYIAKDNYTAKPGDVVAANGRVWELQIDNVTIEAFGADSSGATQSDSALQLMKSRTKNIIFGSGTYLFNDSSTFTLSGLNGVVVRGQGRFLTRLIFNYATGNLINLNGCQNFLISNLTIDSPSALTRVSGVSLNLFDCQQGVVDNIAIFNHRDGIKISGTGIDTSNTIYFSKFDLRNGETSGSSIILDRCVDVFFDQGTSNNPSGSENANGILITECQAAWFSNIDILKSNIGLNVLGNKAAGVTTWLFFSQCAFDNCTSDGARISAITTGTIFRGVFFSQCWTSTNDGNGLNVFSNVGDAQIDGVEAVALKSLNNGQHGLKVGLSKNVNIGSKSMFAGNSQASSGTFNGVQVDANVSNFSLVDIQSGEALRYNTPTQSVGIKVNSGTSDYYQISNCRVYGNINAQILDEGTGINKSLIGNI